ncbi:hypothetical protein [Oceaniglobus trochenteri]|uniref:hypothetical protein n=1 Tax=Oceaniglobus trochenteri TaxID=2763260 RepID=UPI001CFF82BD|nr:hypothetical protein [Oceaniglobus trochenteri]
MLRIVLATLVALWATGAAAQSCSEIKFARGASSGAVSGVVAPGESICFLFGSGAGQTARIRLSGSNNVCFGIDGIDDCQEDFSFRTQAATYVIRVHQLFRSARTEPFRLDLSIR